MWPMTSASERQPNGDGGSLSPARSREALLTGSLLIAIAALAWVGVVTQAAQMQVTSGPDMAMSSNQNSGLVPDIATYLIAWGVMMAAMMLPSATPMIALYSTVQRKFSQNGQVGISTALFGLVYFAVWLGFGVPVYFAHAFIERAANANSDIARLLPY